MGQSSHPAHPASVYPHIKPAILVTLTPTIYPISIARITVTKIGLRENPSSQPFLHFLTSADSDVIWVSGRKKSLGNM